MTVLVNEENFVPFDQVAFFGITPQRNVAFGIGIVGGQGRVIVLFAKVFYLVFAMTVLAVQLSFGAEIGSDTRHAQTLARLAHHKKRGCGNNNVVLAAAVEVPLFYSAHVFVPEFLNKTLHVRHKQHKTLKQQQVDVFVENAYCAQEHCNDYHRQVQQQIGKPQGAKNRKAAHTVAAKYCVVKIIAVHVYIVPYRNRLRKHIADNKKRFRKRQLSKWIYKN